MRRALLALAALFALGVSGASVPDLANLSWMAGHWGARVNGIEMEEVWLPPAGGVMIGMHRDVGPKSSSFEFMRIARTKDGLVLFAQPGGRAATPFLLAEEGRDRVVFANPAHDFPQRITYWREGAKLCARVEGPPGDSERAESWCWSRAASGLSSP